MFRLSRCLSVVALSLAFALSARADTYTQYFIGSDRAGFGGINAAGQVLIDTNENCGTLGCWELLDHGQVIATYESVPASFVPDSRGGRCAYSGPIPNFDAAYCNGAWELVVSGVAPDSVLLEVHEFGPGTSPGGDLVQTGLGSSFQHPGEGPLANIIALNSNGDFLYVTGDVGDTLESIASDVPIPEPSTVVLFATGLVWLLGVLYRGRQEWTVHHNVAGARRPGMVELRLTDEQYAKLRN